MCSLPFSPIILESNSPPSGNSIGVAVPKITSVFNSIEDVGWYGSAYLLTITAFQPSFGRLYRVVNTKNTYIACIVIFEGK